MLELVNVKKSYEQKPLLKNISFKVNAGETICLLGASGSGKSTLLRMIAGLEFPESGEILFNHIDLASVPPHLRDFGLVFQDYGLFPHLDIFDNVAFGLKMRNISQEKINARVTDMLETVNLQGFAARKVTELSGGEQQRVALARALAVEPRLLMFDEPLGALDRTLKEDLLHELRAVLHRTKIPAIYVTHDQDEAFTIADRILLLHDGEIIRDGSPADVWDHPNSIHAARMLGVGNIIEGRVKLQNDGRGTTNMVTAFGAFDVTCGHKHSAGESVSLLVKQSDVGGDEIQLEVEDIFFKQDQFRVKTTRGLFIRLKEAPKIGEIIRVKIMVECLG
ncbi:MAG: ABC transporter ATP-binding protein [Anaerolineales bacterium]|nr:ABC transporter ATP-binding protein [Anaerolineales bacterium]